MKKFKSLILPAVIILIGAGAAFATNVAENSKDASQTGYYFDSSQSKCIETDEMCSTVPGDFCTWTDPSDPLGTPHILREQINETSCGNVLYKSAN